MSALAHMATRRGNWKRVYRIAQARFHEKHRIRRELWILIFRETMYIHLKILQDEAC